MERGSLYEPIHGAGDWDEGLTIVNLPKCQEENFSMHSEDTVIISQLIQIRHYTEGASYRSNGGSRQPTNASGGPAAKIQRTQYRARNANYDRIFTFIDLNCPGQCFNVFSQTTAESERLMKYGKEASSVGDLFAILEPDDVDMGSQNVLNLHTTKPFVPLQWKNELVPSVPLIQPPRGYQRYFILKGHHINVHRVNVFDSVCRGLLCDRQSLPSRTIGCGCLYRGRASNMVFEHHVSFTYVDDAGRNVDHVVRNFRSWRTTSLFIKPIAPTTDLIPFSQQEKQIRTSVKRITEIVNNNGGWTIVGWFRK